jgi:hypothetical protein
MVPEATSVINPSKSHQRYEAFDIIVEVWAIGEREANACECASHSSSLECLK